MELKVESESAAVFAVVVTTSHTWGVGESGGGGGDGGGFTRTVEGMGAPFAAALVVVELPINSVCHAKEDVRGGTTACATLISITTEFSTVPLRPV